MPRTKTRNLVSNRLAVPQNPPAGPPDTLAVYFKGDNVLVDPGFENFVQMTGGWSHLSRSSGVNDYVMPYLDLTCTSYLRYPSGCLTGSYPTWCQTSGPYDASGYGEDQAWKVSVAAARSGDYGAAWWQWPNGGIPPGELCPINPYLGAPFSARVDPGDSTTFSVWALSAGDGVSYGGAFVSLRFYNSSFTLLRVEVGSTTLLTQSFQQISHSTSAPPGTTYIRSCVAFVNVTDSYTFVDDATLAVT